ncbi:hypothetical protein DRO53_01310 [Candidatus Bathyarchaeota archaeon]|nr:MAG: hypothetical protein DRO46_01175 [Candidatus Hecatellales archaeon]RLI35405.1 MAG: hypothetical protein DRO53_01310 [Candidatus Bathyarchaeota archaeon]
MKIAYISTYPPTPCGVAEYTKSIVEMLKGYSNVEITILADRLTRQEAYVDDLGIRVVPCFKPGEADYGQLLEALESYGPFDILHIQHEFGLFPPLNKTVEAFGKAKKHCRKLVITLHTIVHGALKRKSRHQRKLCRLADGIVVHSVLQEFELWNQGVNMAKVWRIPHGTPVSELSKMSKEEALKRLGLPELKDKFIFASVGFLRRDKGQDLLLEAFRKLKQVKPNVVLMLAGLPHSFSKSNYAKDFNGNLGDGVVYLKKYLSREEVALAVRAADVVVFPYREAPCKVSVSGAFRTALGGFKPVICTRVPRLVECSLLAPEATVPPNHVSALAEKMAEAVEHYEEFAEACRPLMELAAETTWDKIACKHLEMYKCLLRKIEEVRAVAG